MKQRLGDKKQQKCERATGIKFSECWTCGGWDHYWAECWEQGANNAFFVNYQTGEWEEYLLDGKPVDNPNINIGPRG